MRTGAAVAWSSLVLIGCASGPVGRPQPSAAAARPPGRFEFTQPQMGVPFRMVFYAPDAPTASNAAQAAFARVAALNRVMSDYEDDSELTQLSRTAGSGRAVPVSEDLWRVLARAQRLAGRSEGAFDVTVGPAVQLWRRARRQQEMPDPARLQQMLRAVGHRKLVLDPRQRTATLTVPGMRLDLGGIAKGYAVDEALKTLRTWGITRALVSGGGDLAVGDPPPGAKGWRIEIAPLDATNAPPQRHLLLKRCALATSGDLFQHVELNGRRYSHIVDPRTGVGLTDHSLVTVLASDCTTADSLSTVVSVLGPSAGLKLIEATPKAAAHVVRKPAEQIEVFESKRFRRFVEAPQP
ncbi:MAG TPA: FAD:protein FMN transferase [Verrucomicrobiae bacterium]